MKVRNEYVEIKVGNKTFRHENMILNEYLYKLFDSQLDINHDICYINNCYLRLDTPIPNVDYDSIISKTEFEVQMGIALNSGMFSKISNRSQNTIKINYQFDNSSVIIIDGEYVEGSVLNKFANRKIMGIGFGSDYSNNILAYLDTSNMNIVINYDEEISIIRVDSMQSDGVCDGIDYPLHLVNDFAHKDVELNDIDLLNYYTMAQLYSVGFGNIMGSMEEEYLIEDVQTERTDNSITFNVVRDKNIGKYPSNNLFPGFYPTKDNSKYLIFKYRLYKRNKENNNYYYLNDYYTMSMPNETFGDLNIKLKIERI